MELEKALGVELRGGGGGGTGTRRVEGPEPSLREELVEEAPELEDLGVKEGDDLVDFGFEPEKRE